MKFKTVILLIIVFNSSCKKKDFTKEEQNDIFNNCLEKILETKLGKEISDCYLVSSKQDTLSLYHYSELEKEVLYKATDLNKNNLSLMINNTENNEGLLFSPEINKFSNCSKSYTVFSSTKIFENLIQVTLTDYYLPIEEVELENSIESKPSQLFKHIFQIKDDCEVKLLLETAVFYD